MSIIAKQHDGLGRHELGNRRVPSLRFHKASGQMFVVLSGRAIYCGKPDDPDVQRRYEQALAEWMAAGRQAVIAPDTITVKELLARFWVHAEGYYRHLTDGHAKELEQFALALRPLKQLYEDHPAAKFGPLALKTVRQRMIEMGWSRKYINKQVNRIRHVFKWAVGDELLPPAVHQSLQAVTGLKKGRTEAPDYEPVKPAPLTLVEPLQPYVSRQVWALIQLQLLTGARAGELTVMRPSDIDRSEKVWLYEPKQHKGMHLDHDRKIWIGPRAQEVLAPFLLRAPEAYCFSPAEAVDEWRRQASMERVTPLGYGNSPGSNRKARPRWTPGDRYATSAYRLAIVRGCDRAFPPPAPLARAEDETLKAWRARLTKEQKAELTTWRKAHRWHPHQLRHTYATRVRREFGLEAAQILLGHANADVTQIYAERNTAQATQVAAMIG